MKKFVCHKLSDNISEHKLNFEGYNTDLSEPYFWHLQFPLLVNTGHKMFKVEETQYFSESSQFGREFRASKGQAIAYFQQNLEKFIQLVKGPIMQAIEELKLAEWYKKWFDEIEETTKKLKIEKDEKKIKELKERRDQAIITIKDKWATEVDGGKIFTISKSGEEKGLDFVTLDNLFFGVDIEDPLDTKTVSEQLERLTVGIQTTETTLRVLKGFLYRFYMWLPTAIKQTKMTYSIRKNSLKQLYSNYQLYMKFLKPLLLEIKKKQEYLDKENFYNSIEELDPFITNLIDTSQSHIKLLLIRYRKINPKRLRFTKKGFEVKKGDIEAGEMKGKEGFIVGSEDGENKEILYKFKEKGKDEIVKINSKDLKKYPCMVIGFTQKRYSRVLKSPQGDYLTPYNINQIHYRSYAWDLYECASFIQKLKIEEVELIENYVQDVKLIKEDLINYISEFEEDLKEEKANNNDEKKEENKKEEKSESFFKDNFLFMPFKGLYELFLEPFSPTYLKDLFKKKSDKSSSNRDKEIEPVKVKVVEEMWKTYTIFKKSHKFVQY